MCENRDFLLQAHLDEQFPRDPPSYDSVIQDSKYFFPSPPPYSAVACLPSYTLQKLPSESTNGTSIRGKDVIIDVTKLSNSPTTSV